MNNALTVAAPAKLNLYLHVTGRRADGYHTLASLIAFAGLCDTVTAEDAAPGTFTLVLDGPFAVPDLQGGDNLALRAAHALDKATGGGHGCALRLTKNIPVAAGLGGGSADAAATLLALAHLWRADGAPLAGIGLALGADVPVCLASAPSLVTGIGEGLAPAPELPPMGLVLVNPRVAVETRAVFAAYDADPAPVREVPGTLPAGTPRNAVELSRFLAMTANDLTAAARGIAPEVARVLAAIAADSACRLARMAGSGATCFGLYDDRNAAKAAALRLADGNPGWWVWSGGFRSGR